MSMHKESDILCASESECAEKVRPLREAFHRGVARDLSWRLRQLAQLERMVSENEEAVIEAVRLDLGKPRAEAATAEIDDVCKQAKLAQKNLVKWVKPQKVSTPLALKPGSSFIVPSPYGVALIIGAWNYPFQLTLSPLVGAIAAGNCALLKPSELAPNSSALIAKLVAQYLDPDAFTVVQGGAEVSGRLLKQRFDLIFYTGGTRVASIVMESAAKYLTPVILELGGKNPCVVDETANLEVAAKRIIWGRCLNAGQTCVSPDHVYIPAGLERAFHVELGKAVKSFFGADPKSSADFGRIVNESHTDRLAQLLHCGRAVIGGDFDIPDRYIAPTVLTDVAPDSVVMTEEIFGPILPVLPYERVSDILAEIRSRPPALALYVFSKKDAFTQQVFEETQSGSIVINDAVVFMANANLPFGGVGQSGMGAYHGRHSFDAFSHSRALLKRGFALDSSLRYPPFDEGKLKQVRRFA